MLITNVGRYDILSSIRHMSEKNDISPILTKNKLNKWAEITPIALDFVGFDLKVQQTVKK